MGRKIFQTHPVGQSKQVRGKVKVTASAGQNNTGPRGDMVESCVINQAICNTWLIQRRGEGDVAPPPTLPPPDPKKVLESVQISFLHCKVIKNGL